VREIPGFLSDDECAHLIARADPVMRRSKVVAEGTRSRGQIDRDSSTAFLDQRGDRVVRDIKLRTAAVVDAPVENQERIQVTHYLEDQCYELHHDALRTANVELGESGDRIHTLIIYLNDDYEGGATYFPRIRLRIRPCVAERSGSRTTGYAKTAGSRRRPRASSPAASAASARSRGRPGAPAGRTGGGTVGVSPRSGPRCDCVLMPLRHRGVHLPW
jgi:hypothetical protein